MNLLPSKFRIKRLFKGKLVNHVAQGFAKIHLKPNYVTIMGPLFSILAILLFYFGGELIGSILFGITVFFIMLLDGVDGALARLTNTESKFGGFFDSTMDRYSDIILISGFLLIYEPNLVKYYNIDIFLPLFVWVFIAIIGFFMTSYSRSLADKFKVEDTNIGLLGRTERLLILMISAFIVVSIIGLTILAIFSNLTALFRIIVYGRKLKKEERNLQLKERG